MAASPAVTLVPPILQISDTDSEYAFNDTFCSCQTSIYTFLYEFIDAHWISIENVYFLSRFAVIFRLTLEFFFLFVQRFATDASVCRGTDWNNKTIFLLTYRITIIIYFINSFSTVDFGQHITTFSGCAKASGKIRIIWNYTWNGKARLIGFKFDSMVKKKLAVGNAHSVEVRWHRLHRINLFRETFYVIWKNLNEVQGKKTKKKKYKLRSH